MSNYKARGFEVKEFDPASSGILGRADGVVHEHSRFTRRIRKAFKIQDEALEIPKTKYGLQRQITFCQQANDNLPVSDLQDKAAEALEDAADSSFLY